MAKVKKTSKTAEEIKLEGEKKLSQMSQPRQWKWKKNVFNQHGLKHWGSAENTFERFNCRTEVIRYSSLAEYKQAGIENLPSSSSWTKEETDCLMELCSRFNLRFLVIADRFVGYLKEKYD